MKREFILVNKNGEIVYNCQKMFPQYFNNHIILRDKDILRIIPYQNGKLDFEKERTIKENKALLHYLEGKIYQIKEQSLHIIDISLSLQNKINLPPFDTVIFSEIEFDKLTIGLKKRIPKPR